MSTNWNLVRSMMSTAIDACERLEALEIGEADLSATTTNGGQEVSVFDILTSAWTYPEMLRYQIARERHENATDQPYVPEAARVLVNVAQACAELVGAGTPAPAVETCENMVSWYRDRAVPLAEKAINSQRSSNN